jgi:hypothetical protein
VKDFTPVEWIKSRTRFPFMFLGRNEVCLGEA